MKAIIVGTLAIIGGCLFVASAVTNFIVKSIEADAESSYKVGISKVD